MICDDDDNTWSFRCFANETVIRLRNTVHYCSRVETTGSTTKRWTDGGGGRSSVEQQNNKKATVLGYWVAQGQTESLQPSTNQPATTAHRNAKTEDENGKKLVFFYVPARNAATMSICKESLDHNRKKKSI